MVEEWTEKRMENRAKDKNLAEMKGRRKDKKAEMQKFEMQTRRAYKG